MNFHCSCFAAKLLLISFYNLVAKTFDSTETEEEPVDSAVTSAVLLAGLCPSSSNMRK